MTKDDVLVVSHDSHSIRSTRAGRTAIPERTGPGDPLADLRRIAALRCRPYPARHRLRRALSDQKGADNVRIPKLTEVFDL